MNETFASSKKREIKTATKLIKVFKHMAESKVAYSTACEVEKMDHRTLEVTLPADAVFSEALKKAGLSDKKMAKHMKDLMDASSMKIDKNGEVHEHIDYPTRLKTLELWAKITGAFAPMKKESKNLNINKGMSDEELDSLLNKGNERTQTRKDKKTS